MHGNNEHIGYLDLVVYEHLFSLLPGYLATQDVQYLLSELREDLPTVNTPNLKTIHQTTLSCSKCENLCQDAQLPKWNLQDPDILFVAPNQIISQDVSEFFLPALKEAGFSANRCALTFATRCSPKNSKVTETNANNCSLYLHGEISHLKPKLIFLMGKISAVAFSEGLKDMKLDAEGGVIKWLGPWAYMCVPSLGWVLSANKTQEFKNHLRTAYEFCY